MDDNRLRSLSKKLVSDRNDYMNSFRRNLDVYVSQRDITLREIAEEADISLNTLNSILYGNVKDCKLSTTIALARALHISIDELVGCETISEDSRHSLQITRNLPPSSQYLIHWFVRNQERQHTASPRRRMLNVMQPTVTENGNILLNNEYKHIDISAVPADIRSKVFLGIKLNCEHYMPTYSPYDILLIANDRIPSLHENSIIVCSGHIFIAKRKAETINGKEVIRYYSIRDEKPRLYEDELEDVIGYIAGVYTDDTLN